MASAAASASPMVTLTSEWGSARWSITSMQCAFGGRISAR